MSASDGLIVRELIGLLSAKGEAPRDASDCAELIQHLVEVHPELERHAAAAAWQLIVRAALTPDPPSSLTRPLAAAKHLLALGSYPEDIERDTNATLEEVRRSKPASGDMDPIRWVTVRRKIAARAGGFGADPSNLNPSHKGQRLKRVAEALWEEMKKVLGDEELASHIGMLAKTEGAPTTSSSDSARQVAMRRLRRIERRRLSRRVVRAAPMVGKWLVGAVTVFSVVYGAPGFLRAVVGTEQTSNLDPLVAMESGEGWVPGLGPDQETRDLLQEGDLALNVTREVWIGGPAVVRGSFVSLSGDFSNIGFGPDAVEPGRYEIEVRVRLENEGYWGNSYGRTENATIAIGILPLQRGSTPYAVFARVEAEGVSPIWDGEGFLPHPDCDCSFSIDPASARLFSEAMPEGTPLEVRNNMVLSPIGFHGLDGVLRSSPQYDVRVVATLVVTERAWEN